MTHTQHTNGTFWLAAMLLAMASQPVAAGEPPASTPPKDAPHNLPSMVEADERFK